MGLAIAYRGDENVKLYVGMAVALAFLPLDNNLIVNAFHLLTAHVPEPDLVPLMEYIGKNYVVGRVQPQGNILPPRLPPEVWNVFNITLTDGSRTNNICEGWNLKKTI